jgi:hypothetical protein
VFPDPDDRSHTLIGTTLERLFRVASGSVVEASAAHHSA